MRKLIDNYIMASDSIKIGEFDDLTLLDFVMDQGEMMTGEDTPSGQKEGAAEAIENNICLLYTSERGKGKVYQ